MYEPTSKRVLTAMANLIESLIDDDQRYPPAAVNRALKAYPRVWHYMSADTIHLLNKMGIPQPDVKTRYDLDAKPEPPPARATRRRFIA